MKVRTIVFIEMLIFAHTQWSNGYSPSVPNFLRNSFEIFGHIDFYLDSRYLSSTFAAFAASTAVMWNVDQDF